MCTPFRSAQTCLHFVVKVYCTRMRWGECCEPLNPSTEIRTSPKFQVGVATTLRFMQKKSWVIAALSCVHYFRKTNSTATQLFLSLLASYLPIHRSCPSSNLRSIFDCNWLYFVPLCCPHLTDLYFPCVSFYLLLHSIVCVLLLTLFCLCPSVCSWFSFACLCASHND